MKKVILFLIAFITSTMMYAADRLEIENQLNKVIKMSTQPKALSDKVEKMQSPISIEQTDKTKTESLSSGIRISGLIMWTMYILGLIFGIIGFATSSIVFLILFVVFMLIPAIMVSLE